MSETCEHLKITPGGYRWRCHRPPHPGDERVRHPNAMQPMPPLSDQHWYRREVADDGG